MFKTNLTLAFQEMTRRGLVAKQNFRCCLTCAGYEITKIGVRRVMRGRVVNGGCIYTQQDDMLRLFGQDFSLAYGPINSSLLGLIGLPTLEVGKLVCQCLDRYGIGYAWNGDPELRILVRTASIRPEGFRLPEFSVN